MPDAYLLVSHGSRDPRPQIAIQQLAVSLRSKLQGCLVAGGDSSSHLSEDLVGVAFLELHPQPLYIQIQQFAKIAIAADCERLKILPLFLLPGVHVMEDIPSEVELARDAIGEDIVIDLKPYLGLSPKLQSLLTKQVAVNKVTPNKSQGLILLSHGSRRPDSNVPVEVLAESLGAVAAYWSVSPSLQSRVQEFLAVGHELIAIFPYFLFAGGITDAIAQSVEELKLLFPGVSFQLAQPLAAIPELAEVIWDFIHT
jgi:sirohydrochlorin cobaltochelatase